MSLRLVVISRHDGFLCQGSEVAVVDEFREPGIEEFPGEHLLGDVAVRSFSGVHSVPHDVLIRIRAGGRSECHVVDDLRHSTGHPKIVVEFIGNTTAGSVHVLESCADQHPHFSFSKQ